MIAPHKARAIRELLIQGELSQRKIARKMGVARDTVAAIASRPPDDDDPAIESAEPPKRCLRCGHIVYMPCRQCLAEDAGNVRPDRSGKHHLQELQEPPMLETNFKGAQRRRYEAIRAKKPQKPYDDQGDQLDPATANVRPSSCSTHSNSTKKPHYKVS